MENVKTEFKKKSSNLGSNKPKKCLIFLAFAILFSSEKESSNSRFFNKATCFISIEKMMFFTVILMFVRLENRLLQYFMLAMKLLQF